MLFISPKAQELIRFSGYPSLPDREGFAGMLAGVSGNNVFCMGGANFPEKKPWEGGIKKWYANIYRFDGERWHLLKEKLRRPLAYGISVTWKNEIIIAGGNNADGFYKEVTGWHWTGDRLVSKPYPSLPVPLAGMAGCVVDHILILAGGTSSFTGKPLNTVIGLDLNKPSAGWFELPALPGIARQQGVCAAYNNRFYLFSGEGESLTNDHGKPERQLLEDAWSFHPVATDYGWTGRWESLPAAPKSVSASASPVPVLPDGNIIFWGGVDKDIVRHADPATHPGLGSRLVYFNASNNTWTDSGIVEQYKARVTLPSVQWKNEWLYISGEVKPGIRTNAITSIKAVHGRKQ